VVGRSYIPPDKADSRALSRAIRPEQGEDGAVRGAECQILNRGDAFEGFGEVEDAERII
jgi:hypothetical protein